MIKSYIAKFCKYSRIPILLFSLFLTTGRVMAEEITFIHDHALFFDEILNYIPDSMYLKPTEEDSQRWMNISKVSDL